MTPAGRIAPQPWMQTAAVGRVLAALAAAAPAPNGAAARFVGGCVRDAVIGRAVKDIDIATPLPPDRVCALLEDHGIRVVPTGLAHGTVTAVTDRAHFEITTLRRDIETFGRHARVEFTDDWVADARRRDFTINALFCDADGTLYDPVGGLDDLRAGRVRFVGDALARIREDVLRLLRFFRFQAIYGRAPPDPAALAACREMAPALAGLSAERVWSELRRILAAPDAAAITGLMADHEVLMRILPEAGPRDVLARLVVLEAHRASPPQPLRRLAALIAPAVEDARPLARRLRMSNAERRILTTLVARRGTLAADLAAAARHRVAHELGAAIFADLVLIDWAAAMARGEATAADADWAALLAAAASWQPARLPVSGRDARALGVAEGAELGRLLRTVEDWWIARGARPDRAACLAEMRRLVARSDFGD
jgi:poly(A) polymerase